MNELLEQGLAIMGIGMGTVLLFLCLMIIAMFLMSAVVRKLNIIFPEVAAQTVGNKKNSTSDDTDVVAAIVAAMFKHK